jgi:hypothetical protein
MRRGMLRSVRVVVLVAAAWTMRAGAGAALPGRTSQAEPASAAGQAQPASAARERLQRAVLTEMDGRQTLTQQITTSRAKAPTQPRRRGEAGARSTPWS